MGRVLRLTGGSGVDSAGRAFFVAELLAPHNLAQAARSGGATPVRPVAGDVVLPDEDEGSDPERRWSAEDARAAACDTLAALQSLHAAGWLHRDVKPSNYGWRNDGTGWCLFDMGLAARAPLAASPHAPTGKLTGSANYASPGAHEGRATGRRDDAWSWLFLVVEQWAGTLPWRATPDRSAAAAAKRAVLADPAALAREGAPPLPDELARAATHLASLGARDAPDYELLRACVVDLPAPVRCAAAVAAEAKAAAAAKAEAEVAEAAATAEAPASPPAEAPASPPKPTKKRRRRTKSAPRPPPPLAPQSWRPPPAPAGFVPAAGAGGVRPAWQTAPPPPPPQGWQQRRW